MAISVRLASNGCSASGSSSTCSNRPSALIALPYDAPGIETTGLLEDEFLFAATPDHRLAKVDKLNPAMLADEPLLLLEDGHCLRDHAVSLCSLDAARGGSDIGATSLATLVQMVAGGLGVSLLPRIASEAGVAAGADVTIRPFETPVIGRQIGIAWRAGSSRERDAKLIGDVVRRVLSQSAPNRAAPVRKELANL